MEFVAVRFRIRLTDRSRRPVMMLVVVVVLAVIGALVADRWTGEVMDDRAGNVVSALERAVEGLGPSEVLDAVADPTTDGPDLDTPVEAAGGVVNGAAVRGSTVVVTASVGAWWALWNQRCVVAQVADGSFAVAAERTSACDPLQVAVDEISP